MIILQFFLWMLFALVLLVGIVLCLKITVRLKYGEQNAVIVGIGFVRINLTKLRQWREKRKKKPKIERLSKILPNKNSAFDDKPKKTDAVNAVRTAVSDETENVVLKSADLTANTKANKTQSINPLKAENKSVAEKAKNAHENKDAGIGKMLSDFIKGKSLRQNLDLLKEIIVQTSEKFSKHAPMKVKKLTVTVSCPDAADTAVLFGIANGVVCSIVGIIESFRVFSVKKGAVGVYQDYVTGKSSLEVDISLSMRVFAILQCTLPALITFMKIKTTKSSPKENRK